MTPCSLVDDFSATRERAVNFFLLGLCIFSGKFSKIKLQNNITSAHICHRMGQFILVAMAVFFLFL